MSRTAVFEVTLSREYSETVTVQYETADGTSKAESGDYVAKTGTLTFAPGETTKQIQVSIRADDTAREPGTFYVKLKNPTKATLLQEQGLVTIPGDPNSYLARFNYIYNSVHNPDNKYFGPQSGASENQILPLHVAGVDSLIINEAPDYGGETVSETASFWVGLEAWKGFVSGDWAGYNNAWDKIDRYYVPSDANQPVGKYNPASPADYTPEGDLPSDYPRLGQPSAAKGVDPLYAELKNTYGNAGQVYLMHWIIDVEGMYGFKNGDGQRKNVYINTYERGKQESSFETVTHSCWNDWQNGGSIYGYDPLFSKGMQWYPEAPFDWGKKWSYTNAPDAEARAIQWAFWAKKFATEQGKATDIADSTSKATKMGDYLRYNLFDKYFRQIGNNQVGATDSNPYASCHYLINWYAAWGGEIPETGVEASWGYRIGCAESHQGYQGLSTAWALATGGGGMKPLSPSAGDIWKGSLLRQIEMIRWLQSPEGAIAGGVTNSWNARYETPDDGRNTAKFYGMVYTYSPVWHDPPSNKWAGFQAWGQGRTADLFVEVAGSTNTLAMQIAPNLEIILDRLVGWFLRNTSFPGTSFLVPSDLRWHSTTPITGQTATRPNSEGVYEYLPNLNWDGSGNYSNFWNANSVPNVNLHCNVETYGADLGVASSLAYLLITYAQGKRLLGKFDTTIPNSTYTPRDAYLTAKKLLDRIWTNYQDEHGIGISEPRADYTRYADKVYVPTQFTGAMPNGDPINQSSTFISLRSFLKSDSRWPEVQAYINNPVSNAAPVFTYHRFWAQAEYAISCAAMYRYFDDINAENQTA